MGPWQKLVLRFLFYWKEHVKKNDFELGTPESVGNCFFDVIKLRQV